MKIRERIFKKSAPPFNVNPLPPNVKPPKPPPAPPEPNRGSIVFRITKQSPGTVIVNGEDVIIIRGISLKSLEANTK